MRSRTCFARVSRQRTATPRISTSVTFHRLRTAPTTCLVAAEVFAHYAARDPMFDCLRNAVARTPYPYLTLGFWVKTEPVFAAYRADARFAEVLRASGLP